MERPEPSILHLKPKILLKMPDLGRFKGPPLLGFLLSGHTTHLTRLPYNIWHQRHLPSKVIGK